ncbi:MAG: type II toxin-antitoxin system VapC family toxin [Gammaproteobacteria bacterium]|nr:type II toxin-antitoxin system VapC family toxin [Gammaproteobacteria bacterium]
MITLIDTNILLDIFGADPKFGHASSKMLRKCLKEGAVHACEIVWAETATAFPNPILFKQSMDTLSIEFSAMSEESALLAAKAWHHYRLNGGKRERVIADFLIGAHASLQGKRLLTRDRGFYRKYFKSLSILDPSA